MTLILAILVACRGPSTEPSATRTPVPTPVPDPPACPVAPDGVDDAGEPLVRSSTPPTNLIMLSIDTLRADHVERMPFLTGLLDQAVVAADHQQCSNWTLAGTHCTLSGWNHEETDFLPELGQGRIMPLPDGEPSLARTLGDAGFQSLLVTSNPYFSDELNNVQGYDEVLEELWSRADGVFDRGRTDFDPPSGTPWFLHLHFMEPHFPYVSPAEFTVAADALEALPWDMSTGTGQGRAVDEYPKATADVQALIEAHLEARYEAEVRFLDAQLADGWAALEAEGWLDDALVVIWSDHGEQHFERGGFTHGVNLAAEENNALLAFLGPGIEPRRWTGPTHAIDVLPTVLDALDLPVPGELKGERMGTAPAHRLRYATSVSHERVSQAVTSLGVKLHFSWISGRLALWSRADDPEELVDLVDVEEACVAALWEELEPRVGLVEALAPDLTLVWPFPEE